MELTEPSPLKDYEIDVLIGKLAAILIIVRSFHLVWRAFAEGRQYFGMDLLFYIIIPCLYIISLHIHNIKLARLTFRIWLFWFLYFCLSLTGKFLVKPSGYWTVIFPFAFMTACMITGVDGVVRIKEPDKILQYTTVVKIAKHYHNIRIMIGSIGIIMIAVFTFTFMVFIGKYLCDFVLLHWPSLEKNRILLFYAGVAIGFYPSFVLGGLIPSVLTVLFERIWNLCVKQ